jgi:hypothetical protein
LILNQIRWQPHRPHLSIGYATLGTIGFEGRFDYAAIGTVSNVASRLCDDAKPGQILFADSGPHLPALLLNYLGQGAYLLGGAPLAGGKLFYSLVPPPLLYPVVLLATVATVIASQALISGAFSLCAQAIRLGLFSRLSLLHTHQAHAGQIYVPFINRSLF